jgi:HlyD family secretion protein
VLQDGESMDRRVERPRRWLTLIATACFLAVAVAVAVSSFPSWSRWASADRSIELASLRLGEATRGDLVRDVSVQGRVVAAEQPTLVSPAQGVVSLLVKAGDVVSRGMILARIDSPEMQSTLEQERSSLLSLDAALQRLQIENRQKQLGNLQAVALLEVRLRAAERAMERAKALFDEGLGSSMDYQRTLDELEVVRLELDHARQKVRLEADTMDFETRTQELEVQRQRLAVEDLERRVSQLEVVSPVSGLVSRVDVRDKDTVQPNQVLFGVVDLSRFEVEIQVPENFADQIGIDTRAMITHETTLYEGSIRSLSPEVENSQFKAVVTFLGDSPRGLKQNQRVSTRLFLDSHENVVKVPRGPFLESMGGRQVYLVREGIAELTPISVGAISVTEVEVLSGLNPGDRIVLSDLSRFEGVQRILLRK